MIESMISPLELEQVPTWLRGQLGHVGPTARVELLSSRRGVTTLAVTGDSAKILVKLAETTKDGMPANTFGVSREAAVLSSVDALRERFQPLVAQHDENVALLETWIEGTPAFQDARRLVTTGDEAGLFKLLRLTLGNLAELHCTGWTHGDLQPLHFLLTENGAVLLDYGVAQSNRMPMPDYKGGMVHFNAPEVAADVIATGRATATTTSDVFSLGAVFAFAITGKVIGDYEMNASWDEKLAVLARGHLRTDLLCEVLTEMPTFRDVLLKLLTVDVVARPNDASAALQLLPITT